MAHSPMLPDRGTRFTNYSSIHSQDAFVGEYQVMYTPGSSPPVQRRKTSSRFAANPRVRDTTRSIIIPPGIPDTSAILPDRGTLRDVHVHYNIPPDEKEIVASLRKVQKQLDQAMNRITELEQERDEACDEIRMLRASIRKSSSPTRKREQAVRIEEELFDLSRVEDSPVKESPPKAARNTSSKRVSLGNKTASKTTEDNARVISPIPADRIPGLAGEEKRTEHRPLSEKPKRQLLRAAIQDTEESIVADPTAASNTSRRRRRTSLDENMTSAYILPDITVSMNQQQQQQAAPKQLSKAAQAVLHDHDPQHLADCEVCRRLTSTRSHVRSRDFASTNANNDDFTAQVTHVLQDIALEQPTLRPRIAPSAALAHLKKMLNDSYLHAKNEHGKAWEQYDRIPAPMQSKRHMAAADDMKMWAAKMEESRVHLDQLRDVEEGMKENVHV